MFLVAGIAPSKDIAIEGDVSPETVYTQLGRVVARVVTGDDWHPALTDQACPALCHLLRALRFAGFELG